MTFPDFYNREILVDAGRKANVNQEITLWRGFQDDSLALLREGSRGQLWFKDEAAQRSQSTRRDLKRKMFDSAQKLDIPLPDPADHATNDLYEDVAYVSAYLGDSQVPSVTYITDFIDDMSDRDHHNFGQTAFNHFKVTKAYTDEMSQRLHRSCKEYVLKFGRSYRSPSTYVNWTSERLTALEEIKEANCRLEPSCQISFEDGDNTNWSGIGQYATWVATTINDSKLSSRLSRGTIAKETAFHSHYPQLSKLACDNNPEEESATK